MLYKLAESMAQSFYAQSGNKYDEDDIELYAYGLQAFLSTVFEVLFVLIWGLCVGRFFETIAFFGAFIPLRSFAGGYHAKTVFRCFLVLLMVYALFLLALSFIPAVFTNYASLLIVIISSVPILKFAPIEDANKPIGPIQRKGFRKKSVTTFFTQAVIIIGMSIFCIILSPYSLGITEKISYICLSFAIGQLSVSGSLVAAKIKNAKGCEPSDCQGDNI